MIPSDAAKVTRRASLRARTGRTMAKTAHVVASDHEPQEPATLTPHDNQSVIRPALGYGGTEGHALQTSTLVFYIQIVDLGAV